MSRKIGNRLSSSLNISRATTSGNNEIDESIEDMRKNVNKSLRQITSVVKKQYQNKVDFSNLDHFIPLTQYDLTITADVGSWSGWAVGRPYWIKTTAGVLIPWIKIDLAGSFGSATTINLTVSNVTFKNGNDQEFPGSNSSNILTSQQLAKSNTGILRYSMASAITSLSASGDVELKEWPSL